MPKSTRVTVTKMAPRWRRILDVLQQHPPLTLDELAGKLGKRPASVQADLSLMRNAGIPVKTVFRYGDTRHAFPRDTPFSVVQTMALQLTMRLDELSVAELEALSQSIAKTIDSRGQPGDSPRRIDHAE